MKTTVSLKKNHEFQRIYRKGRQSVSPYLALYIRKRYQGGNYLGFTVSKKVGGAVVRNRVRRRLREIYRLHEDEIASGYEVVIVARVRAASASYAQLENSFLHLCDKLGLRMSTEMKGKI